MSKKTLLAALLISSLSLSSTIFASAATEMGAPSSIVGFKDCEFGQFPLSSSARTSIAEISFKDCAVPLTTEYFSDNPTLRKLSLAGSSANFAEFTGGKFGQGCPNLEALNLREIKGLSFEQFLSVAAPELLDRIVAETCKLKFSRADSGATLARFSKDTKSEELSLEEIKRYISMYRTAQAALTPLKPSDQPASPNGGVFATLWSMFGGTQAAK